MARNSVERFSNWVRQVGDIDRRLKDTFCPMTLSKRARVEGARRDLIAKIHTGGFEIALDLALMSGNPQFVMRVIREYPRSSE